MQALLFNWKQGWLNLALLDILDLGMYFFIGVSFGPINELLLLQPMLGGTRPRAE